ncbi:TetR family transcriptional regulator, partial [Streptomyces sp. NPDC088178]
AALDEGSCEDALRRLVAAIEPSAGLFSFLVTENQLFEGDEVNEGWDRLDARVSAFFRRGQERGELRIDLTPAWLTEALYGLVSTGAWAVQAGRVAGQDFQYMIVELLLGGARRSAEQ